MTTHNPKISTTVGGMDVAKQRGHGVLIESIHWEHYAQRIEEMDMPSLDEGNFLAGSATVFVSMVISLVGIALGTEKASPWLYAVLSAVLVTSGVLTFFFWRKYTAIKKTMAKTGATLCREMREVAEEQKRRAGLTE